MLLFVWIVIFISALIVMIKGADWFLDSAEKIGLAAGLSPFVVGVVIVGFGTSFPELIASIAAIIEGVPDVVVANAVGSNIANIFLVVGISAIVAKKIKMSKSLIDLDLPLLALATTFFLGAAWDGSIAAIEAAVLVVVYGIYLAYSILHEKDTKHEETPIVEILPARPDRRGHVTASGKAPKRRPKIKAFDLVYLLVGVIGLLFGAKYLIDAIVAISEILAIGTGVIALTAAAFGTSLPEVLVSLKAAWQNKSEVALGNIFGSNVFNLLIVVGIPGIFVTLPIDEQTLAVGVPTLIAATVLFIISGISQQIYKWEGVLYLLLYLFFIGKLFGLV